MGNNYLDTIASSYSGTRKKLKQAGYSSAPPVPEQQPAPAPAPVQVQPTPVRRRATRPVQAAPTQMPTDIAVALGALQQRGEPHGVDTTTFDYAAPDWGKVVQQMDEVNKVFDLMDSEINRPPSPQPRAWEQGVGGFVGALGDNFPHLFAESNPDASFWDRSTGRTTGAVGRGLRQTVGRPALGVGRAIGEVAQGIVGSNEEAIANLARPEEEVIAGIFSDLGVTDPEQWNDFVKKEGKLKADLLLSRRILAEMGSSSFETGTQATSGFTDEENLAANQTRIKRLLELDPATGKTVAEGMMRRSQNPAEILKIGLAIFEASEGVATLGTRLALSQIGRQIDIANGGDGSKGEMWGDIIGSFAGSFPKNPAAAMRVGDSAGTVYRSADDVATGLRAAGRPVQQGKGIAGVTGLDFMGEEARDVGQLAKLAATPLKPLVAPAKRVADAVLPYSTADAAFDGKNLSPEDAADKAAAKAAYPKKVDDLPVYEGEAWRTESGYTHGRNDTAGDVIRFEIDELGNDETFHALGDDLLSELDQYKASDTVWVARDEGTAADYNSGNTTELYEGAGGAKIIFENEDGALVLRQDAVRKTDSNSLVEEGSILGDDFGKAPEGTVITVDGVETRLDPQGNKIVETTATPVEDAPAFRQNPTVALVDEPDVIKRIRNESPGGGSAQLSEAEQIELRDWLRQNGTDFNNDPSVGGMARGSMGRAYGGDTQIIIGSYKSDVPGFDRQLIAWNPVDGGFRTHNTMPDAQSQRITRARMENFGVEETLGTPGEGSARTIEIFSDDTAIGGSPTSAIEAPPSTAPVEDTPSPRNTFKGGDSTLEERGLQAPTVKLTSLQKSRLKRAGFDFPTTVKGSDEMASLRDAVDELGEDLYDREARSIERSGAGAGDASRSDRINGQRAALEDLDKQLREFQDDGFTGLRDRVTPKPEGTQPELGDTTPIGDTPQYDQSVDHTTVEGLQQLIRNADKELEQPNLAINHIDAIKTNRMQYQRLLDKKVDEKIPEGLRELPMGDQAEYLALREAADGTATFTTSVDSNLFREGLLQRAPDGGYRISPVGQKRLDEFELYNDPSYEAPKVFNNTPKGRVPDEIKGTEKAPLVESQRVFGEDGNFRYLDPDPATSEKLENIPDKRMTQGEMSAFDELRPELPEEKLSEFPVYEQTFDDTPVGRTDEDIKGMEETLDEMRRSLDEQEEQIPGHPRFKVEPVSTRNVADEAFDESDLQRASQAEFERNFEIEQLAKDETNPIGQFVEVLPNNIERFPEAGLTPRQAYYIIHGNFGLDDANLAKSGGTRIQKKADGTLGGGTPRSIAKDYQDWAMSKWGGANLDPGQSRPFYRPGDAYYTHLRHTKEYKAAAPRKNWKVDVHAIDEPSSAIVESNPARYDIEGIGGNEVVELILRDIEEAKSAKIQWKAIEEGNEEALKQEKLARLNVKNAEQIQNEGIVEVVPAQDLPNPAGARRADPQADIPDPAMPVTADDPLLGSARLQENQPNRQNPIDASSTASREGAEQAVREVLRGYLTDEEIGSLPETLIAKLNNLELESRARGGTMSAGGKGIDPRRANRIEGTAETVELGPPLDIDGRTKQATMGAIHDHFRQPTSEMLPIPKSPAEAKLALAGQKYMPNPKNKAEVASAGSREILEDDKGGLTLHERITKSQEYFIDNMGGVDEPLDPKMVWTIDNGQLRNITPAEAWRLDPGRMAATADNGQQVGPVTDGIIEPTQRLHTTRDIWQDAKLRVWEDLKEKWGVGNGGIFNDVLLRRNHRQVRQLISRVAEYMNYREVDLDPRAYLDGRPNAAKILDESGVSWEDKKRIIGFVQDLRTELDDLRGFQNGVRSRRHPNDPSKLISYQEDYIAQIKKMNDWANFGGLLEDSSGRSPIALRDIPDFTQPDAAFNARAETRKWGMQDSEREWDIDKIYRGYVQTAGKDVFNTEIMRNIKRHTKAWREASNKEYDINGLADAFENYGAEAYLGVPTAFSKSIRNMAFFNNKIGVLPVNKVIALTGSKKELKIPTLIDSSIKLRQMLTRTTFPANWTWNMFIQTSSGLLTPVRYGVRNSVRAVRAIFDPKIIKEIEEKSYIYRSKAKPSNSVTMQATGDATYAYNPNQPLTERVGEWVNFISTTIEKSLTRHAIRAAYLRGEQLGYTGRELWQYASQGGARTQSMYNREDTVGFLRSREASALFPFQTFAFEMMNTVAELNVPVVKRLSGNLGAYESIAATKKGGSASTARRWKMMGTWLAGAVAANIAVDRAANRKPWNVSSFVPMWAMLSGGVNGLGPGSALLPVKFTYDFSKAFFNAINNDDWTGMRSILLRYGGVYGGTQIDKSLIASEAVRDGAVRNTDRTVKFRVENPGNIFDDPEMFLKTYVQGIWSTNGGQEHLDNQLGRNDPDRSGALAIAAQARELTGLDNVNIPDVQKLFQKDYNDEYDAYYIIPSDEVERERLGFEESREEYRRSHPETDAYLFIGGRLGTLKSGAAVTHAKRIILEKGLLKPKSFFHSAVPDDTIATWEKVLGATWVAQARAGNANASNVPEGFSERMEQNRMAPFPDQVEPEPSSFVPSSAQETWDRVSANMSRENLVALDKIWKGGVISRTESASLRKVFAREPLGQTNFRKWSKQTLRQIQENSANSQRVRNPREAVTV